MLYVVLWAQALAEVRRRFGQEAGFGPRLVHWPLLLVGVSSAPGSPHGLWDEGLQNVVAWIAVWDAH